jgi:hypothetical protein
MLERPRVTGRQERPSPKYVVTALCLGRIGAPAMRHRCCIDQTTQLFKLGIRCRAERYGTNQVNPNSCSLREGFRPARVAPPDGPA